MTKEFLTPINAPYLEVKELGTSPATPASGNGALFTKSDGVPYWKNDDGVERALLTPIVASHENPGFEGTYVPVNNYTPTAVGSCPPLWSLYWCQDGSTYVQVAALTEGTSAVRCDRTSASAGAIARLQTGEFGVLPGDIVTFEVDVKGSGTVATGTVTAVMHAAPTSGSANYFGTGETLQQTPFSYTSSIRRIKAQFVVPVGCYFARLELNNTVTGNATGSVTFDNSGSTVTTPVIPDVVAGGCNYASEAYSTTGFVKMNSACTEDPAFTLRGGFTIASGGLVAPVAGVYHIMAMISFGTGGTAVGGRRNVGIGVGGGGPVYPNYSVGFVTSNASGLQMHNQIANLGVGSNLSLWRYVDAAGNYGPCTGTLRIAKIA